LTFTTCSHLHHTQVVRNGKLEKQTEMVRPRTKVDLQEDFEAIDGENIRCLMCPLAPVYPNRKVEQHRATAVHTRDRSRSLQELSTTSARRSAAEEARRERGPSPAPLPVYDDDADPFDEEPPPVRAYPMARSQFDRGWDAMGDRNEALWDLGAQTEEERRMIAELEGQMANANRIDDDGDFWPWPDRGTYLLSLLVFCPRSPLSCTITEGVLAFTRAVQRYEIPTYSAFRSATESIRRSNPSADSVEFKGSAGNMLFYNSISSGIARDFGNLRIRNHMHFYSRKADYKKELRDGDTMAESPSRQPMVTLLDGTHAYLDEPLALTNDRATVPRLWYTDANDVVKGRGPSVRIRPSVNGQPMHAVVDANESIDFVLSEVTRGSLLAANLKDLTLFDENGQKMSQHHKLRTCAKGKKTYSVPLLVWEDDWRGTLGVGNYSHTSVLYSNAFLDRVDLDRRSSSVRFFSTSASATPEELFDAFVKEVNTFHGEPFFVWDERENDTVLIRPWVLAVLGDTVMLNQLSSSIGVQGNLPCRICDWGGGTRSFKYSADGVLSAMKEGPLRTSDEIVRKLEKQLDLAQDDKTQELLTEWTTSGIKDVSTTDACTILLETNDKLRGKVPRASGARAPRNALSPQEIQNRLAALRASLMVDTWHSPLHRIIDFGGLQHTLVDILHVASLGAGKYLAKLTDKLLTHAAKDHLRVRLEGVSTTAITDSAEYPAATMMRRLNTLNGKQVKVLAQLMPFALAPLIEDEMAPETLLEAWISYARLSRFLYVEYIPSIDIYQISKAQFDPFGWRGQLCSLKI
ncbi:hypothetical protein CF335_g8367, partial [Tilletia laevis]